jgi:hypothetical protein
MKTTIEVSDELYRRAKAQAALQGRKLKDLVEEGLRLVLKAPAERRRPSLAGLMKNARGAIESEIPDRGSNPAPSSARRRLFQDQKALAALCRRHHIRRLALFGSTLKGTARPDSDVDLLVEFEPEAKPSLFTMAKIEMELSELLGGRKVDLRTAQDLSRYFRDDVVRTAQVQYEGG